jgi:hypothetical protein
VGNGHIFRFPRWCWVGDPPPKETPPEKEEDETGTITDEAYVKPEEAGA